MLALGSVEYQERAQGIVEEITRNRRMYEEFLEPVYAIKVTELYKQYSSLMNEVGMIQAAIKAAADSDFWQDIVEQQVHEEYARHYWENALMDLKWTM